MREEASPEKGPASLVFRAPKMKRKCYIGRKYQRSMTMTKNTLLKAQIVQHLVEENYEEGRQDRCKLWVWRTIVRKQIPMSQRTFYRLLTTDTRKKEEDANGEWRQTSLFD